MNTHVLSHPGELVGSHSPAHQAYQILHVGFTVAPIIAGFDKFTHFLVNWNLYLAPAIPRMTGIAPRTFMMAVGVIEIAAGLLVAMRPRIGVLVVGVWLCGIILNLVSIPAYLDVALRDLGLAMGAFALARLSVVEE